jgi:hypothetical protein
VNLRVVADRASGIGRPHSMSARRQTKQIRRPKSATMRSRLRHGGALAAGVVIVSSAVAGPALPTLPTVR